MTTTPHPTVNSDFLDRLMLDHEDNEWSSHFDNAYDSFIAQPLSSVGVIDPKLFDTQIPGGHELPAIFSGSVMPMQSEQFSVGIVPILLSKPPSVDVVRETVKVMEKSVTEQLGGKEKEMSEEVQVKEAVRPLKSQCSQNVSDRSDRSRFCRPMPH